MQRTSLMIDGFLAYDVPTTITYTNGEITAITGPNGSGKTSIPDAVAWVRYGQLRIKNDADSVVNDFCEQAHVVEEVVGNDGQRWKFDRKKKREKPQVLSVFSWNNLTSEWDRYGTKRIADNQEIIDDLVGLNMNAFYSLSVFESRSGNRGIRLVSSKSDERIGILTSLRPNMAIWPELHRLVSDQKREAKRSLTSQEDMLAALKDDVAEMVDQRDELINFVEDNGPVEAIDSRLKDVQRKLSATVDQDSVAQIEMLKAKLDAAESSMRSKVREINLDISAAQTRQGEFKNAAEHVESLTEEIAEINDEIAATKKAKAKARTSITKLSEKLEVNQQDNQDAGEKIASLNEARKHLEDKTADLEERLRAAEDSESHCVVCGSEISEHKHEQIVAEINEQLDVAEQSLNDNDDEARRLKKERVKYDKAVKSARSSISAAESQIEHAADVLSDLDSQLRSATKELAESQKIVSESSSSIGEIDNEIDQLKKRRKRIESREQRIIDDLKDEIATTKSEMPNAKDVRALERGIERIQKERDEFTSSVARRDQLNEQITERQQRVAEQSQTVADMREELEDLDILREATSQRGIPYLMLSDMLTNIEVKADEYLALINGRSTAMTVDLVQNYESSKPSLEIMVAFDDGTQRPVEALSNGEITRVSLSLMFAMAHVVNASRPGTVSDVFLDEPLAAVDDLGIEGVIVALRHAIDHGVVDSIMVVAHDRSIVEACDVEVSIESIRDQWREDEEIEELDDEEVSA